MDEIEPNRLEWTKMNQIDQIGPKIGQLDRSGPNMIFKEGGWGGGGGTRGYLSNFYATIYMLAYNPCNADLTKFLKE